MCGATTDVGTVGYAYIDPVAPRVVTVVGVPFDTTSMDTMRNSVHKCGGRHGSMTRTSTVCDSGTSEGDTPRVAMSLVVKVTGTETERGRSEAGRRVDARAPDHVDEGHESIDKVGNIAKSEMGHCNASITADGEPAHRRQD